MASYAKGTSGNPAGRRHGSRNKATIALDKLAADKAGEIVKAMAERAAAGDTEAARIVLARCWPPRRGRPVRIELPPINSPADIITALSAVVSAMAAGEISAEEGQAFASVLEQQRKAYELLELEARVQRLEQAAGGR